jgi:outer membrane receptor protein involved in Fe transport
MFMRKVLAFAGAAALLAATHTAALAQSSTAGAIKGTAKDSKSGEALVGVTIVATSPALQGTQSAISGSNGVYTISNLPPGVYQVKFYWANTVVTRNNIEVNLNKVTPVHGSIDQTAGEEIVVNDQAPTIDPTSTTQGITLDQNYTQNIPVPGRTFEAALGAAAGSQGDALGVSFSGSTSLENSYVVDGVNTTGLTYGTVGSPIINDFIKEIEIITGGYQAEFGRSTGGVVNVVTEAGTNEFHGAVFSYFSNDLLAASRRRTPTESASIDAETDNAYDLNFGFKLGGPIIKDKLWFFVGFAPRLIGTDIIKITKRRTDCRMIMPDGSLSTPADQRCSPEAAAQFGDGSPDEDPETGFLIFEELSESSNRANAQEYQFVSKINYSMSPEHQGQATFSGTPFNRESRGVNGDPVALTRQTSVFTTDLSLKWTSKFNNSKTEIEATAGWHRSKIDSRAKDPLGDDVPRQVLLFGNLATWSQLGFEDVATRQGCIDSMDTSVDPYPLIENCPDNGIGYNIGGVGFITDDSESRMSGKLVGTQRINAGGNHEIKAGLDFEQNLLNRRRLISGGTLFQNFLGALVRERRWVRLAPPGSTDPRFAESCGPDPADPLGATDRACQFLAPNDPLSNNDVQGNTFNWAAFLRDSWQILPNLTFNAGVRYEEQRLRYSEDLQNSVDPFTGNELGTNAMVMGNMWAPRIGLIYDWTKEGRSKVYTSWGRFYESIPMDINDRSFGGETLLLRSWDPTACGTADPGIGGPDAQNCLGAEPSGEQLFGSGVLVAPGIKPQYLDEFIVGAEYEVLEDLKLGLSYQNRRMGRVLEDVSVDNADTYILANPGEFDSGAEAELQAEIDALAMDDPERARLESQLEDFQRIEIFDKPRRDYNAVTVTATKRFNRNLFMQGSYTYSRTEGNYPGLFSADNGQVDPNITSQYDLIELLANRDGPLPQDRPHYFKLDGYYNWNLGKKSGIVTPGIRFRALSGIPRNVLAAHFLYGFDETFLLPRGERGRTESDFSLDIHAGYARDVGNGMKLEVFGDLFSIFNTQGTFSVDRTYTFNNANPVVGGDFRDLIWTKQLDTNGLETAQPITRNPNFGNTAGRYSPFSARLGARLSF